MPDKRLLILPWFPHSKGSTVALSESLPLAGFRVRTEWRRPHSERDVWPWLAKELDKAPPEYAVHFQRLYPSDIELRKVFDKHKVKRVCLDLAPIPFRHYSAAILDVEGDNAASSIVGNLDKWLEHPIQRRAVETYFSRVDQCRVDVEHFAKKFTGDLDVPDDFIFLALQTSRDQVVRHDSSYGSLTSIDGGDGCMMALALEAIEEAKRRGKFVVIKPHPVEHKWEWELPERGDNYLVLPRKGMRQESNDHLCAWLWQHCVKCIVVNSTMLFGALFAGKPVAMLGRGWATGNGVVQECGSLAEAFEDYTPDAERVKLFLALILSRCRTHEELRCHHNTKKTFEFLDALRGNYTHIAEMAPPIIKTIYIDNQDKLKTVKYCLEWTIKKNPNSRVILAVDQAPPEFEHWALGLSPMVEVVSFPEKRPRGGRMNLLMGLALKRIMPQEKMVITAEQDTIFSENIIPKLKELMEQGGPKTAAIQAESCLFGGKRCYPSFHVPERHRVSGGADIDEKTVETNHATFSTTIWRTQALREVDWTKTRVHSGADLDAANQIKDNGWKFYQTFHVKAIHQSHTIVRDGFGIINHLKNKHKGRACYVIGKGPSLDAVTAETFERGCPIICINESIHHIEALGIDNPLYVIQQDKALKESCRPSNEKTTILLAGLCERFYKKYQRRIVHRPEYFDVKPKGYWPHSSLMAVKYARLFGCGQLKMIGFDQIVNGDSAYADSLKDKTLIPTSLNLRMNNELLIDEIGKFPSQWFNNGSGFIRLDQDVQRDKNAFANIVQDGAWKGRRCFIVGGGPSLDGFDWSLLDGELVIAANRGFESCNPQIIVSCDPVFTRWVEGKQSDGNGRCSPESAQKFRDLKCLRAIVKVDKSGYPDGLNFLHFAGNDGLSKALADGIVCGRNSGFTALNLAVLLGASQIYLLGLDMRYRPSDNKAHYYDKGRPWKAQDPYPQYIKYFNKVAPEIKARGHRVINLSKDSALSCFEKGEFPEPSKRPVYVSCYTVNSPYVKEIDKLVTSLIQHGLPYDLWPYEAFGSHIENCSYISTVCREAVEKYPNRPVVFLPADAIVRRWPEVLENMPSDIDFAAPYFKFSPSQKRKELNSSCLYFAPTAAAQNLTREWERRCKLDRQQWDQKVLRDIIDADKWGGKWISLPGTYCKIYDNTTQPGASEPPVIEAFMASRRFREAINAGMTV